MGGTRQFACSDCEDDGLAAALANLGRGVGIGGEVDVLALPFIETGRADAVNEPGDRVDKASRAASLACDRVPR
jgi:hypothetical protein